METTRRARTQSPPVFRVKALAIETVAVPTVRRLPGAKEAFDFALASAMLAFALPVMALALSAVRATSRGPALYRQTRLGRFRRPAIHGISDNRVAKMPHMHADLMRAARDQLDL